MSAEPIAIYTGSIAIYWSGLVICLGIAAGFFLSLGIYMASNRESADLWVFFPFALVFSVVLCRLLHWYCHEEQYVSWVAALTDYSTGSYCLQGALLGVYLGALCSHVLGFAKSTGKLLDAIAPGFALSLAFIRLSSLFNSSCHSKYTVEIKTLQRLPVAILTEDTVGNQSYRFATFFVEFVLLIIITLVLIGLYYKLHNSKMKAPCKRDGHIFRLFLILFCTIELVLDSTRNDSSFLHFPGQLKVINKFFGFVSVGQLCAAIILLCILIYYTRMSVKANGRKWYHIVLWIAYGISLATVGGLEYCVQRWSNYFRTIYIGMSVGALLMGAVAILMYRSCIEKNFSFEDEYK